MTTTSGASQSDAPTCAVDKGELPVLASKGSGLCPGPSIGDSPDNGLDDESDFCEPAFPTSQPFPELLGAELQLCQVSGAWGPWHSILQCWLEHAAARRSPAAIAIASSCARRAIDRVNEAAEADEFEASEPRRPPPSGGRR